MPVDESTESNRMLLELLQRQTQLLEAMRTQPTAPSSPVVALMPDVSSSAEPFTGRETPHAARHWLEAVEAAGNLHGWPDNVRLEVARGRMTGPARDWFAGRKIEKWSDFITAFKRTYVGGGNTSDQWRELLNRRQNKQESTEDYLQGKFRLCRELSLPFTQTKTLVVEGLWSKDLAHHLVGLSLEAEDELRDAVVDFERVNANRLAWVREERTERSGNVSTRPKTRPRPTEGKSSSPTEPRCYACQKPGHIARDCPTKASPKCYRCGKTGHISRNCPMTPPVVACLSSPTATPAMSDPYVKEVLVGQTRAPASGQIDSGSTVCTMKASAAVRLGLRVEPGETALTAFGATEVKALGCLREQLEIDGIKAKVCLYVIEDAAQPTDVIVGRSWTDQPHIGYEKKGAKLTFKEVESEFAETVVEERRVVNLIWAKEPSSKPKITIEDIKTGQRVTDDQKGELVSLLNDHRDAVALHPSELGCTNVLEAEIQEIPGSMPVRQKPYRASRLEREKINKIIDEWIEMGIVTETESPYASPVLLVGKADGTSRLVVDYRRLNQQTIRDPFPLPVIDDIIENLGNATMWTTLDLAQGYLQVPLKENSKMKTAFITPDRAGQFERLSFGLTNGPPIFQRLMNRVLGALRNRIAFCYLDDVIIPARGWDEMAKRISCVFGALGRANLTVNLRKCLFGAEEINYLGYRLEGGKIHPGQRKTDAIRKFPRPTNIHEVRQFLGLTSYFRRFVDKFAVKAAPLSELLKKGDEFTWSESAEESFQKLKDALCGEPVLALFQPKANKTEIHTDACGRGIAGILLQSDSEGALHPVYYLSKKLNSAEQNYHATKQELLAVIWSLRRLRPLILGLKVTVYTDCQAIAFMHMNSSKSPQIARWADELAEFDVEVRHREGKKMAHVDALSRQPVEDATDVWKEISAGGGGTVLSITLVEDEVRMFQARDEKVGRVIKVLERPENERSSTEKNIATGYVLKDGLLFRRKENRLLFVIPDHWRKALVIRHHDMAGHRAVEKTVQKIQERYWFPRMRRYVRRHIATCLDCIVLRPKSGRQPGLLHPIPPGEHPFATVHIDFVGPLLTTPKGNKHIFVLIDNLTRFVRLFATDAASADGAVSCLREAVAVHGVPRRIISDRGSAFTSNEFEAFCREQGIKHVLTSTQHPQGNGMAERVNRSVIPMLISRLEGPDDTNWDLKLNEVMSDFNDTKNKSTGFAPFQLLFGYSPRTRDAALREFTDVAGESTYCHPPTLQNAARETIKKAQEMGRAQYDQHRIKPARFQVGEIVFMRLLPSSTGEGPGSLKFKPKWRGPLAVFEVLPADTYRVTDLNKNKGRIFATTAHASQLRSWGARGKEVDLEDREKESDDSYVTDEEDERDEAASTEGELPRGCVEQNNSTPPESHPAMETRNADADDEEGCSEDRPRPGKRAIRRPTWLSDYV